MCNTVNLEMDGQPHQVPLLLAKNRKLWLYWEQTFYDLKGLWYDQHEYMDPSCLESKFKAAIAAARVHPSCNCYFQQDNALCHKPHIIITLAPQT